MIDRYSKAVLTIIAAALVAIVAQNTIGPLNAQSGVQRVVICDPRDPGRCASLGQRQGPTGPWYFLAVSQGVQ
jgi:hypothetical protein